MKTSLVHEIRETWKEAFWWRLFWEQMFQALTEQTCEIYWRTGGQA